MAVERASNPAPMVGVTEQKQCETKQRCSKSSHRRHTRSLGQGRLGLSQFERSPKAKALLNILVDRGSGQGCSFPWTCRSFNFICRVRVGDQ